VQADYDEGFVFRLHPSLKMVGLQDVGRPQAERVPDNP
jgi:hypothetical protein